MIKAPIAEFCNEKHMHVYMHSYGNFMRQGCITCGNNKNNIFKSALSLCSTQ